MAYGHLLGIDPGVAHDPTGWVLVRVTRPSVVVRAGEVLDAATGQPVALPEGVTAAEYVASRYEVADSQSRRGITFDRMAREARATVADLDGDLLCVVDQTGLGRGAVEQIRQAGVPVLAVNLTAGHKVTSGGRWEINVPTAVLWTTLYAVLAQGRARAHGGAARLVEELRSVEHQVNDAGREHFELPREVESHADSAVAFALAVVAGERINGRVTRAATSAVANRGGRQRKPGVRYKGDLARRVVRQRLDESRRETEDYAEAERERFRAAGWTKVKRG